MKVAAAVREIAGSRVQEDAKFIVQETAEEAAVDLEVEILANLAP